MADNPAWPTEDEDFDAVHSGGPISGNEFDDQDTSGADQAAPAPKKSTTSVKITSHDDEPEEEAQSEPAQESEEPESQNDDSQQDEDDWDAEPAQPEAQEQVAYQPEDQSDEWQEQPAEAEEQAPEEEAQQYESEEPEEAERTEEVPAHVSEAEVEPSPTQAEEVVDYVPPKPAKVKPPKPPKTPGSGKNTARIVVELLLAVAVVGLGLWAWSLHSDNKNLSQELAKANSNPQNIIQKQTDDLISKVSKLMQLPQGETPTIANVTDAEQAKKQSAFFTNAQNGDKVLMYVKAGEAILYRPSTNKIVLVAPLTFTNDGSATTGSSTSTTSTTPSTSSTTTKTTR